MKYAVVETGGKQYRFELGKKVKIEKIEANVGDVLTFDKILMSVDGEAIEIGKPYLENVKAQAKVVAQERMKKVIVYKYAAKTRRTTKKGHRQYFTEVEVVDVTK